MVEEVLVRVRVRVRARVSKEVPVVLLIMCTQRSPY
jgi:hypothetical protein